MSSTFGRLIERSQSVKTLVRSPNWRALLEAVKVRSYRLVALAVSTLFFGYFSTRFPNFWVLAMAGVLNKLSARLLVALAVFAVLL
jgi:hypothetical protein